MPALVAAFFVTAVLYASVGFGGGSTYTALLALSGIDYRVLPLLALACNIVVVTGGTVRFARAGLVPWKGALSLTVLAAPAAFVGGLLPIAERQFLMLLGLSLMVAGALLFMPPAQEDTGPTRLSRLIPVAAVPLGLLAGMVGIGGGIFLAPLLHLTRWNAARQIAATASLFILVNSIAGLLGQLLKGGEARLVAAVETGLPMLIAVAIGGQIGSLLAVRYLPLRWIRIGTGALTLYVGARHMLSL